MPKKSHEPPYRKAGHRIPPFFFLRPASPRRPLMKTERRNSTLESLRESTARAAECPRECGDPETLAIPAICPRKTRHPEVPKHQAIRNTVANAALHQQRIESRTRPRKTYSGTSMQPPDSPERVPGKDPADNPLGPLSVAAPPLKFINLSIAQWLSSTAKTVFLSVPPRHGCGLKTPTRTLRPLGERNKNDAIDHSLWTWAPGTAACGCSPG